MTDDDRPMASPLEPKPGFDWTRVRWIPPGPAPVDETCSYCGAAIADETVPLWLWNTGSWAAVFCEGCMQTWWGFQSMTEDGGENVDPYVGSESDVADLGDPDDNELKDQDPDDGE
jgi:hypothetical protein